MNFSFDKLSENWDEWAGGNQDEDDEEYDDNYGEDYQEDYQPHVDDPDFCVSFQSRLPLFKL